ncbi:MAG: universal stress protein [Nitrosomonadaceae bacterium]
MQASIKKIILATDFSNISKDASYYALLLAQTFKAELKALHVFDTSVWSVPARYYYYLAPAGPGFDAVVEGFEEIRQRGKDSLKKLAESFDLEVETIFTEGDPGHEIVRVAEELNADPIVLGTQGYKRWRRFTIGSVAEFVVRHAPCAVLTIRHKEKWIKPTHQGTEK